MILMSRYSVEIFESYIIEPGVPTIPFTLVDLNFHQFLEFLLDTEVEYLASPYHKPLQRLSSDKVI